MAVPAMQVRSLEEVRPMRKFGTSLRQIKAQKENQLRSSRISVRKWPDRRLGGVRGSVTSP